MLLRMMIEGPAYARNAIGRSLGRISDRVSLWAVVRRNERVLRKIQCAADTKILALNNESGAPRLPSNPSHAHYSYRATMIMYERALDELAALEEYSDELSMIDLYGIATGHLCDVMGRMVSILGAEAVLRPQLDQRTMPVGIAGKYAQLFERKPSARRPGSQ